MDPSSLAYTADNLRERCDQVIHSPVFACSSSPYHGDQIAQFTVEYTSSASRTTSHLIAFKSSLVEISNILRLISSACNGGSPDVTASDPIVWVSIKENLDCIDSTLRKLEIVMRVFPTKGIWGAVKRLERHLLLRVIPASQRDLNKHRIAADVVLQTIYLCLDCQRVASRADLEHSAEELKSRIIRLNAEIESTPAEKKAILGCLESLSEASELLCAEVVSRPVCAEQAEDHDPPPPYTETVEGGESREPTV